MTGKGVIPPNSINTVPQTYELTYTYANGVILDVVSSDVSIRFEGTGGWVGSKSFGACPIGLRPSFARKQA